MKQLDENFYLGKLKLLPTAYKNNAQTCLTSKVCARFQRLIFLRTIKIARSHCFYTGRCVTFEKMNMGNQKILKLGILIPMAIYAFFGLIMISLVFTYLNQSSLTPMSEQLTFINFLLPLFITLGFLIYFPILITKMNRKRTDVKQNWIKLAILGALTVFAVPWQIEQVVWQLDSPGRNLLETAPYLIGIIFTIGTVIIEILIIKRHTTTYKNNA